MIKFRDLKELNDEINEKIITKIGNLNKLELSLCDDCFEKLYQSIFDLF